MELGWVERRLIEWRGRGGGEVALDKAIESAGDFGRFRGIGQSIQEIGSVTGPDFIFDFAAITLEPHALEADLVARSVQEGLRSLRA